VTASVPTVLVSVPHGAAAGNVLRTGLVGRLLDSEIGCSVVLLSPLVKDAAFVREFAHPRVRFEDLPPHRPSGLEARLLGLMQAAYLQSRITESVRIRREEAIANRIVRWIGAKQVIAEALAPSMTNRSTRYRLSDRLVSHEWAERLFDRDRPALLVTSSPGLIFSEVPLLRTAARRRVRSIAVDPSWDNFTNKLLPVRRVDCIVVWNDLMKTQAVDLHGYEPDEVRVVGAQHWDLYFHPGTLVPREAFFRQIGADPARKLITLTTSPRELYPHFAHLIRALLQALNGGVWNQPVQLLVRVHPRDRLDAYGEFQASPHLIVEKPFRASARAGDGLDVDVTADAQRHLANTMRHSDVVVQVSSTIAIEAAIFDTPVVNVAFDGPEPAEWVKASRRYLSFTHFANILRHGAVHVAETPQQMVEAIGRYLADPSLDREGRRKVVLEQCQFLDGRSADRVAACVVDELADATGAARRGSLAEVAQVRRLSNS
jgi:hypothetical protein